MLRDFIHVKCPEKAVSVFLGLEMRMGLADNSLQRSLHGDGNVLKQDCPDGCTTVKSY